jgi:hypothetical protein
VDDWNRWEEVWYRCACPHGLVQADTVRLFGAEVNRLTRREIVADNAEAANAVVQSVEGGRFELPQSSRDNSAPSPYLRFEPIFQVDIDAVGEQMTASKPLSVGEEVLEIEADGGVICGDHRPCADAHDAIDGDALAEQFEKHAHMRRTSQAAGAQDHRNPNGIMLFRHGRLFQLPVVLLRSLSGLSKNRVRTP